MKLLTLTLDNFSSHRSTTVQFDKPILLITGALNSGKSSIVQSLEYAMTGTVERYRGARSAFQDLIHDKDRTDDSRFTVTLKTDSGVIKRGKAAIGPGFVSWDGQTENAEPMAYGAWRTTKVILSTLLGTGEFFELEDKDQKELILRLVGAEVSRSLVEEAFKAQYGNIDAFSLVRDREISSIAMVDSTYKSCFDSRTDVNRELKQLQPLPPPEGKEPPVDNIRQKIQALESELSSVSKRAGTIEERSRSGGNAVRARIQGQIDDLAQWLRDNPAPTSNGFAAKLTEAQSVKAKSIATDKDLTAQLVQAKATQMVHESNVKTLSRFNGKCVVGPHECPASTEVMVAAKDLEQKAILEAAAEVKAIEVQIAKNAAENQRIHKEIAAFEGQISTAKAHVAEYQAKTNQKDRLEKQIKETSDGPSADDIAQLEAVHAEIKTLQERLSAGRKRLEDAQGWIHRNAEVQKVAARRKALEIQSRHLENLCEFFGPKGIKVRLIEEKIQSFEKQVNAGLEKFGFSFAFSAEPWKITAKGRPVDRLSRSERYRLGVALQVGIAKVTGVNLIVADNAEILTVDAFKALLGLLAESGVQAIVIKTSMKSEEEFMAKPPKGNFDVLWVKNVGGVSEIHKV